MNHPLLLLATLAGMFGAAWLLVRTATGIGTLAGGHPGRFATLDGLRGLLACCVLVHHAYIARGTYLGRGWESPDNPLYHFAGDAAVAVFFMITGLLFWDKALAGRLRFASLMRSRIRRIVPLQAFCLMLVVTLCLAQGDGAPTDIDRHLEGVVRWLGTGFFGNALISGMATLNIDAGVTWSLTIEWLFYLALVPLASLCMAPRRFVALVVGVVVLTFVCRRTGHYEAQGRLLLLLPFCGGMLVAYFTRLGAERLSRWSLDGMPATLAIVGAVGAVAFAYHRGSPRMMNLLLVPAFLAVVLGNDLFTLLRRRTLRWLGQVSFSIYLLHGIVLLQALRAIDRFWPIAQFGDGAYAALVAGIGVAVVGIATATYLLIERAFFDPLSPPRWMARLRGSMPPLAP